MKHTNSPVDTGLFAFIPVRAQNRLKLTRVAPRDATTVYGWLTQAHRALGGAPGSEPPPILISNLFYRNLYAMDNPSRIKMYKEIDLQNWSRLDTYNHFSAFELPFFNICNNIDITPVYQKCKTNRQSISLALQYCCIQAANAIDEFKLRILEGRVVQYNVIHAGAIVLLPDNNIRFCMFEHTADFTDFEAKAAITRQWVLDTRQTEPRSQEQDVIHFSVLPWISFTSISHPRGLNNKMESIPKITLGKFFKSEDRILLPISVEVNHCLMDGYHLGVFNELLIKAIDNF